MIRAHITRHMADITPLGTRTPQYLPAGWAYQVYDTVTRINLIRGVARTQPDALDAANRLIRSLETYGH